MKKKWQYAGLIYLICAIATETLLLYGAYDSGVLQRQHTAHNWLIGSALYLATAAIWPYLVAVLLLMYFGILPK